MGRSPSPRTSGSALPSNAWWNRRPKARRGGGRCPWSAATGRARCSRSSWRYRTHADRVAQEAATLSEPRPAPYRAFESCRSRSARLRNVLGGWLSRAWLRPADRGNDFGWRSRQALVRDEATSARSAVISYAPLSGAPTFSWPRRSSRTSGLAAEATFCHDQDRRWRGGAWWGPQGRMPSHAGENDKATARGS